GDPQGRGQPSPRLRINPDAAFSVGISVNTDVVTVLVTDLACNVVEEIRFETQPLSRDITLQKLKRILAEIQENRGLQADKLLGIGFAISGFFVKRGEQINAPEPLKDWSLRPLHAELENYFRTPVWLENGATTGAIGESLVGAGLTYENFGYLAFNYGFGGGLVLSGKPFFGSHGNAGELSAVLRPEEIENRPGLGSLVGELNDAGHEIRSMLELQERFDLNWPQASYWIEQVTPQLERIIHALTAIIDPQAIVFGGEIPRELAKALIKGHRFWHDERYQANRPMPDMIVSSLENDSSALGAALLPLKSEYFI
uniref:ROK family protein n=1 Tax=uncultured Tateyamaria sp. TaxID=455651 RepID=UPI002631BC19